MNSKGQVSIFGVVAFLIVFFILYVLVFAPFANVASDVSIGHDGVTGIVGFMVNYWSVIIILCFMIVFAWKAFSG